MGQFIPEWLKTIEYKSHELYELVSKLKVSHCLEILLGYLGFQD